MATENQIKEISEVTLNGQILPLKVNFLAIKTLLNGGDNLFETIGIQTPESTLEKLKQALIAGGNDNVTDQMCMDIIDETPAVYGNITKTFSSFASKFYSIVEVGNSPAPKTEEQTN